MQYFLQYNISHTFLVIRTNIVFAVKYKGEITPIINSPDISDLSEHKFKFKIVEFVKFNWRIASFRHHR